jgi:hypothetical protein
MLYMLLLIMTILSYLECADPCGMRNGKENAVPPLILECVISLEDGMYDCSS